MMGKRKYKDCFFRFFFGQEEVLPELYGAIKGRVVTEKLRVNTLQGLFHEGKVNDLSFMVGDQLVVLVEHQSTINENMALRLLIQQFAVQKLTRRRGGAEKKIFLFYIKFR
jgi:hypothetical protein